VYFTKKIKVCLGYNFCMVSQILENPKLQYFLAGEGEPILVVHGSPGGGDQGVVLGQFLVDKGYQIIAPSRPGYLETPLSSGETIDQQSELFIKLLDHLKIKKLPVICWSGGGPLSYRLALKYPQRVSRLVVLSGVSKRFEFMKENFLDQLMLATNVGDFLTRFLANHLTKSLIKTTLKAEGRISQGKLTQTKEAILKDPKQLKFLKGLMGSISGVKRQAGLKNDAKNFLNIKSLELEKVTVPTLIIHATTDTDVNYENGQYAATQIKNAQFLKIEEDTHICSFAGVNAKHIQDEVLNFLS
jgi:pimeloyl-ACP methyl ester carboxylesterase